MYKSSPHLSKIGLQDSPAEKCFLLPPCGSGELCVVVYGCVWLCRARWPADFVWLCVLEG